MASSTPTRLFQYQLRDQYCKLAPERKAMMIGTLKPNNENVWVSLNNITVWVTNPDTRSLRKLDVTHLSMDEDLLESEQDSIVRVRDDGEHIRCRRPCLSHTTLIALCGNTD